MIVEKRPQNAKCKQYFQKKTKPNTEYVISRLGAGESARPSWRIIAQ